VLFAVSWNKQWTDIKYFLQHGGKQLQELLLSCSGISGAEALKNLPHKIGTSSLKPIVNHKKTRAQQQASKSTFIAM
jgi:hypothetical protein